MHENIVRIKAVNEALKGLDQEFVFVGGATVSLYATNPELASETRPTDDVDVVIELATYGGYAGIDEKLRKLGFKNDVASGVICRYQIKGVIVDIMPTEPQVVGFSNRWYPAGFANAIDVQLDDNNSIRTFSLPYFMATKWEAFKGRGKNDYRTSKDFEDLVYVWENVDNLEDQIEQASDDITEYLKEEFAKVITNEDFEEGLYAHLAGGYGGLDPNYIKSKLESALHL